MTRTGVGLALVVMLLLVGCGEDDYGRCLREEERKDAEAVSRGETFPEHYTTPQGRCHSESYP